jgi:hypothetical protein
MQTTPPKEDVALVCTDLMFTSKVTGVGKELGRTVKVYPSAKAATAAVHPDLRLALLDLSNPKNTPPEEIAAWKAALPPEAVLIAYGSHVDVPALQAAKNAGCDAVLPRSAFVQRLVELLSIEEA